MKRPQTGVPHKRTGVIAKDLTTAQLAGVGKVTFAYNEAELWIHLIFVSAVGTEFALGPEVSRRINGADGLVEIVKVAARQLNCPEDIQKQIADVLGGNGFLGLKRYRDSIIHARIIDAQAGIGLTPHGRGKFEDILLTEEALNGVFLRLEMIRLEVAVISGILITLRVFKDSSKSLLLDAFLPKGHREKAWEEVLAELAKAKSDLTKLTRDRLELPPLPEFPEESPNAETARRLALASALLGGGKPQ